MQRKLLGRCSLAGALLVAIAVIGIAICCHAAPIITISAFNRIRIGMTLPDAELALGLPAGKHDTTETEMTGEEAAFGALVVCSVPRWGETAIWSDNSGHILLVFEGGRVVGGSFQGMRPKDESVRETLRRWFQIRGIF